MLSKAALLGAGVIIVLTFAALLATFEASRGGDSREAEYIAFAVATEQTEERIKSFVTINPAGIHHVGDLIEVRITIAFDDKIWEVSDDTLKNDTPFEEKIEVNSRSVKYFSIAKIAFLEARWTIQCFLCRDEKNSISFNSTQSPGIKKKNIATGRVDFVSIPSKDLVFAPLPNNEHPERTLPRLAEKKSFNYYLFFVLAGICLIILAGEFACRRLKRRGVKADAVESADRKFTRTIVQLERQIESADASATARSLYRTLLAFSIEYGQDVELTEILKELSVVYGGEEIAKGALKEIILRVKSYVTAREV